ncbi:hypothetical protein [Microbacterium sp. LCT-H2]|uniref:helix-turn-helix domain-containing protein n=1 Tax=Microbacterium sp. LCT-H2 TaxID=1914306 RepID=UPI00115FD9B1|nr:hypothetical protein [Microbacterium sp. LCT-H2]
MSRTEVEKAEAIDRSVLLAASRLRLRALALIDGAMRASNVQKATLAARLGVRRSAVQHTLSGSGNVTLQTLAEYLGVLDLEVELVPVYRGEVSASMRERRAPTIYPVTMRDHDWRAGAAHIMSEARRPGSQFVWGRSDKGIKPPATAEQTNASAPQAHRVPRGAKQ